MLIVVVVLIIVAAAAGASFVAGQADHDANAGSQSDEARPDGDDSQVTAAEKRCWQDLRWYNSLPPYKKVAYAAWHAVFQARCGKYFS